MCVCVCARARTRLHVCLSVCMYGHERSVLACVQHERVCVMRVSVLCAHALGPHKSVPAGALTFATARSYPP